MPKFLFRDQSCLPQQSRKTLCTAIILCRFDYAWACWYEGLSKKLKDKLQIMQNKDIRFILDLPQRKRITVDHFEKLGFLNICKRVKKLCLNHIFNIFHNKCPEYLKYSFTRTVDTRNIIIIYSMYTE